jgi:CBS domain-containing protein
MKFIRDFVVGRVTITVPPFLSVAEAARVMATRNIGAVPVADGLRVSGIFTERDALNRVLAAGLDPRRTPVRDVMTSTLVVADVRETCAACLERMRDANVRHLIVLDDGRMAGIVSIRDLLAIDLDEKVDTITYLSAYVHDMPPDLANRRS